LYWLMLLCAPEPTLFPYTTLFRSEDEGVAGRDRDRVHPEGHHRREVERCDPGDDAQRLAQGVRVHAGGDVLGEAALEVLGDGGGDRKSTRLNSSHVSISYAVFCLK